MILLKITNEYQVDTEKEAKDLIEKAKSETSGMVSNYKTTYKTKKSKGEIIDSWYIVSITESFVE